MANWKKKWWLWAIIGFIVILIIIVMITSEGRESGTDVEVTEVEQKDITQTVQASGRIFPEKEVKISSDVSGAIFNLTVKEGDSVQAGDVLAQIDPETIESQVQRGKASVNSARAQLAQSQASVAQAEAQLEQARAQFNTQQQIHQRNEQLFEEGVISKQELEQSQLNLDNALSNLKTAEAQLQSSKKGVESARYGIQSAVASLQELQTSLQRTTIKAPTTGIVSKLNVEEGERVVGTMQMAGTELMRIANFNSMEVRVEVSENDILRVDEGDSVNIEVDAYFDETFKGIVTEIASSAADIGGSVATGINTEQVTNFIVKIRILPKSYERMITEEKQYPFRPGMTANVEIKTHQAENVKSVPISAVTTRDLEEDKKNSGITDDYREVVFVVQADTVQLTDVVTGIQDDEFIEIKDGVELGQKVVSGPFNAVFKELEGGDKVSIEEKNDKEEDD
jgi:HlyD family secretion protein